MTPQATHRGRIGTGMPISALHVHVVGDGGWCRTVLSRRRSPCHRPGTCPPIICCQCPWCCHRCHRSWQTYCLCSSCRFRSLVSALHLRSGHQPPFQWEQPRLSGCATGAVSPDKVQGVGSGAEFRVGMLQLRTLLIWYGRTSPLQSRRSDPLTEEAQPHLTVRVVPVRIHQTHRLPRAHFQSAA